MDMDSVSNQQSIYIAENQEVLSRLFVTDSTKENSLKTFLDTQAWGYFVDTAYIGIYSEIETDIEIKITEVDQDSIPKG